MCEEGEGQYYTDRQHSRLAGAALASLDKQYPVWSDGSYTEGAQYGTGWHDWYHARHEYITAARHDQPALDRMLGWVTEDSPVLAKILQPGRRIPVWRRCYPAERALRFAGRHWGLTAALGVYAVWLIGMVLAVSS